MGPVPATLLPAPTFGHIQVEEVTVEDGLYHSRHHCNLVIEILSLVSPDPVSQVERPVQPQEEQVVGSNSLGLSSLADHEELGQNGHRLQVDRESPEDLSQGDEKADDDPEGARHFKRITKISSLQRLQ